MNKQTIIGIFGLKAGTKLFNWLDPCCTEFCEDVQECIIIPPGAVETGQFSTTADGNSVYEIPIPGVTPTWAIAIANSAAVAGRPFYVTFNTDKIIINFLAPVVAGTLSWLFAYKA